jgi:hypothetical protein
MSRRNTEIDVEKLRAEIGKILDVGDDLLGRLPFVRRQLVALANLPRDLQEATERAERAERSRDKLLASGERHLNDLMTIADKNLARAERAEAECARRGDLLNAVVELVEHREARYAETNGTTINAVPVADLRRALGPAPSDSEELDGHNEGPGRLL